MDFIFAVKTFIAGMLALYIAFCLDLTYPMWAIGTVMIIVNPYSGMVSSKAVYRLFGTAAGAIVATIITPHLINTPFLFIHSAIVLVNRKQNVNHWLPMPCRATM